MGYSNAATPCSGSQVAQSTAGCNMRSMIGRGLNSLEWQLVSGGIPDRSLLQAVGCGSLLATRCPVGGGVQPVNLVSSAHPCLNVSITCSCSFTICNRVIQVRRSTDGMGRFSVQHQGWRSCLEVDHVLFCNPQLVFGNCQSLLPLFCHALKVHCCSECTSFRGMRG